MFCGKNIHLKSHLNNMDFYRKERIAKLATSTDCDHDERESVAIWIAEMAATASDRSRSCFAPRRSCTGYIQRARRSGNASNSDTLRVIDWKDTPAVKATVARIREKTPRVNKAQRSFAPTKGCDVAPSARLTAEERARLPEIEREVMKHNITAARWRH